MTNETTNEATPPETVTPEPAPVPAPPVTIPGTALTPPVSITADEHQLISDLKATGHDLIILWQDWVNKIAPKF